MTTTVKPSLVILAAGMGSRYGGLKQIDTVGDNGESIIDFTIYDAMKAGFGKVYLIIRREHEQAFCDHLVDRVRAHIPVEFVYQDMTDLPEGFEAPKDREKPWGTTHALLACKNHVNEPFMLCNADDFYGRESFEIMVKFLNETVSDDHYGMVGYPLVNTITEHGSVTRAICQLENGKLTALKEIQKIVKEGNHAVIAEEGKHEVLPDDMLCSMNFWGFTPHIFEQCEPIFVQFLKEHLQENPLKCEHVIPTAVADLINAGQTSVEVMGTPARWFGVTYKEDKPYVMEQIASYKKAGLYPHDLWK